MSKTVKGKVQTTSDKDSKDFFGICIDDDWYNGPDSLEKDLEGETVELTVDPEADFLDIEEIDIIEEDSEDDEQGRGSNPANGERESSNSRSKTSSTTTSMSERQASIQANSMTKTAAEIVAEHTEVNNGEFIEEVSKMAHGLNQISSDIREENLE